MALAPGTWTELLTGIVTAAVAGVLGVMAWRQGRRAVEANERANRLAEAALDVRFAAEFVPDSSAIDVRGGGATVWVHEVWMEGAYTARDPGPNKRRIWLAIGRYGPMTLTEEGVGPWRLHRDSTLTALTHWNIDPLDQSRATLSIHYSHTRDGEVIRYLVSVTFPTVPRVF